MVLLRVMCVCVRDHVSDMVRDDTCEMETHTRSQRERGRGRAGCKRARRGLFGREA